MSKPIKLKYKLTINVENKRFYEISNEDEELPFLSINFEIQKSSYQNLNSGKIIITNLSKKIRDDITKSPQIQTDKIINISLEIGKNFNSLSKIFSGSAFLIQNTTKKPDVFTEIEAYDGGIEVNDGYLDVSVGSNSTILDLKKQMAQRMNLELNSNSINDFKILEDGFNISLKNGWSFFKKMFKDEDVYIDNKKINTFDENYYKALILKNTFIIQEITEETGLLDIPINQGQKVEINTFIKPEIERGSVVFLNSKSGIDERYNGFLKVVGLKHKGLISFLNLETNISSFELMKIDGGSLF